MGGVAWCKIYLRGTSCAQSLWWRPSYRWWKLVRPLTPTLLHFKYVMYSPFSKAFDRGIQCFVSQTVIADLLIKMTFFTLLQSYITSNFTPEMTILSSISFLPQWHIYIIIFMTTLHREWQAGRCTKAGLNLMVFSPPPQTTHRITGNAVFKFTTQMPHVCNSFLNTHMCYFLIPMYDIVYDNCVMETIY